MTEGNPDNRLGTFSRVRLWLLVAAAGAVVALAGVCIWAEGKGYWYWAQGACVGILSLLVLTGADWWLQHRVKPVLSPDVETYYQALQYLLLVVAAGIIVVMGDAVRHDHWELGIVARAAGAGLLLAGGAFMIGVLLGFLFGFPSKADAETIRTGAQPSQSPFYNTNLQEVADWLTKLIVGASLVELSKFPPMLKQFGEYVASSVNPFHRGLYSPSPANAVVNLIYFWSCGILFGYIWTRYEMAVTAHPPDYDSEALARVDHWLNQPPGSKDDDARAAMMNAIKAASAGARMRIFLDAERYRRPATEDVNERSLPVFQALVEADSQEISHRNRGQYALALMGRKKDPKDPQADWTSALDLLNDAIRIRDGSREPNWREYELARAVCRIHLDDQFNEQQKSASEAQKSIRSDLDKIDDVPPEMRKLIDPVDATTQESAITAWQKLNLPSGG